MGFLKKLFGFGKKEEEKVDDEIINETNEVDKKEPIGNDNVNDKPTQARNFKYLDDLIHSGTKEIVLDSDIILSEDEESKYRNGIKIDVEIAIEGNGYSIDAKNKTRIFDISSILTLKNITLKNGTGIEGGAIHARRSSSLNAIDSKFIDNTSNENGGAIFNRGLTNLHNTNFINNSTLEGDGGAVYTKNGTLSAISCEFNKNTSNKRGGAIYNDGKTELMKCKFRNNASQGEVLFTRIEDDLEVVDCEFEGNANFEDETSTPPEESEHRDSKDTPVNDKIIDKSTPPAQFRNFKYLDDLIHSGEKEIVLDSDIILSNNEKSRYEDGIRIDVENLVIDGNGYSIDAKNKTRIFDIYYSKVTIKNIILKNGFTKGSGGAIRNWNAELTITSSTFSNNYAADGGAIYTSECELTIAESTFNNNTAYYGGAIYNDWCELIISKSTLNNNTAREDGGAIYGSVEFTITESTLNNNTARGGGAIYKSWGELIISKSTLNNNTARGGGAIHHEIGNFKIFNCGFSTNKSPNNIILNKDSLQIHNATFRNNKSKFIVLNDDGANLGIFNGEFSENNVKESVLCNGGKFCSVEKTVFQNNIQDNTMNIINNSELTLTEPKIKDEGKSILNQNYMFIRNSPPELENKICGKGTVETLENRIPQEENFDFGYLDKKIHENKTKEIILDHDITFENYERDFYEGGIELDIDDLIINGKGHTIDGADKSRIFIITGKNITLKNIIFKNGHSHKNYDSPINNNGGAIKINHDCDLSIENCEFISNTSEEDGGAISNRGELTVTESSLTGNTAQGTARESGGGAILNGYGGILTITSSTLTENTTPWHGGAIYNKYGDLTVTESTFNENIADGMGMDIFNMGQICSKENISNVIFNAAEFGKFYHLRSLKNNQKDFTYLNELINAETNEINLENDIVLNISTNEQKTFENGIVISGDNLIIDGNGHAIDAQGLTRIFYCTGKNVIIKNIILKNGYAENGAAIYNSGELSISKSSFLQNKSRFGGGAIHNESGTLNIAESTLNHNRARYGGAIKNYHGNLTITSSTIKRNEAIGEIFAGIVYVIDNTGGAIYLKESKKYESKNCTFKGNEPDDVYEEK